MADYWEDWQLELLDDYILGYAEFNTQEELAYEIGKSLNAVKVQLSRRKDKIQLDERDLTIDEYRIFLSNRFDKTTEEVAKLIKASSTFLLHELDEIDSLECKDYMEDDFENRICTIDEMTVFINLYEKGRNAFQIAQILNRSIIRVQEMISNYERVPI